MLDFAPQRGAQVQQREGSAGCVAERELRPCARGHQRSPITSSDDLAQFRGALGDEDRLGRNAGDLR